MKISKWAATSLMALFLVTAAFADEVSMIKSTSGADVEVSNAVLANSYAAMVNKGHVLTSASGSFINDDGSVTIKSPVFHYNGVEYPIGSAQYDSGYDGEYACAFFGFKAVVTSESKQLPDDQKIIVLQHGGQLYTSRTTSHAADLVYHYLNNVFVNVTCRN